MDWSRRRCPSWHGWHGSGPVQEKAGGCRGVLSERVVRYSIIAAAGYGQLIIPDVLEMKSVIDFRGMKCMKPASAQCNISHVRIIFTAPATWASPAAPSSSWPAVPSSPLQGVPSCPLLADLFSLACRQHSVAILSERSCLRKSWGVAGCDSRRPLLGHCGRTFLRRPVGTIGQLLSATGFGRGSETGRWRVGLTAVPSCPSQGGLSSWAAGLSWSACRHHEQPSSSDRSR